MGTRMGRHVTWSAVAALLTAAATGCTTAAKEGLGFVQGAKAVTVVIQPAAGTLNEYGRIELEPFADETGVGVPAELPGKLAAKFDELLSKEQLPPAAAGGKTLTVRGRYLYYEVEGLTLGQAISPFGEIIARVQLAGDGAVLAEATCVGRADTRLTQGLNNITTGLAKSIVKWIAAHYEPPPDAGQ